MRRDDVIRRILYTPARWWLRRKPVSLPLNPKDVRKILILRTDAIGDMIVTTPMFTLLHERLQATIDVVASPRNAMVIADDPRIRQTFVFDGSAKSLFAIRKQTRQEHYDLVIALVLHRTTKGGMNANVWAGRKAITATFAHDSRTHSYETWFSAQIDVPRSATTMADMQIQILNALFGWDVNSQDYPLTLHLPPTEALEWKGSPRVVLNISSGNAYRMWSYERNAECLQALHERFPDVHVMVMAHGAQIEMANRLVAAFPAFTELMPMYNDVRSSIASMRGADVVITPDTSMVHGAAALGIPVVGIYSHKTSFLNQWMPHGVTFRAIITDGAVDIDTIEPARVVVAVSEILKDITKGAAKGAHADVSSGRQS